MGEVEGGVMVGSGSWGSWKGERSLRVRTVMGSTLRSVFGIRVQTGGLP